MTIQIKTIPVKPSIEGYEAARLIVANHKLQGWRVIRQTSQAIVLKRVYKPSV